MQNIAPSHSLRMHRDAHGRLALTLPDGTVHSGVLPVRAFPLAAPEEGLSLIGADGHELLWLDRLDDLPEPARTLVRGELAVREFVPTISKIIKVSSFSTPSTWDVETDRGTTTLVLKAEEDIRRLRGRTALLIASASGVQYAIADSTALDRASRRLLERFL
ncbi:MAG: DUF1854 domain-containing protein [Burkholderiaceae bacterium]|nr:DUF1854 domain-containing protein [Burkholderiaceae bacterium]